MVGGPLFCGISGNETRQRTVGDDGPYIRLVTMYNPRFRMVRNRGLFV